MWKCFLSHGNPQSRCGGNFCTFVGTRGGRRRRRAAYAFQTAIEICSAGKKYRMCWGTLRLAFCSDVWPPSRRAEEGARAPWKSSAPAARQTKQGVPPRAVPFRRLAGGPVGGAAPTKCLSLHPGGEMSIRELK